MGPNSNFESSNTLGRYQILREIARSNDVIYEAVDPSLNRRVALKELCLPPNLEGAQKRERIERFYREAKAAGRLSHPNIVTIYEYGEQNGRYYIAMEYLEGQDLQNVLQVRGAMPVQEAVAIALQVCDALAYAHQQGVVHRDIKPDNIQILSGGHIKITDFGIARIMSEPSITTDGQVFGTPSYMSPEQVSGKPIDQRTDLFSLGVVLYEMLTGRKPFTGDSVVTITYNIMNLEIAPPAGLPPYLAQVIGRALAKDPNQRYTTASEMAEDIRTEKVANSFLGAAIPQPTQVMGGLPPTSSSPIPDPYSAIPSSIDIPLPQVPRKPILSPDTRAFLGLAGVVFALIGLFLFSIWALNAAYMGYVERLGEKRTARDMELGAKAYESRDWDTAVFHYKKALAVAPKSKAGDAARESLANCYVAKGLDQFNLGQYSAASDQFREALKYAPFSASAHYWRGNALQRLNDIEGALAEWQAAVKGEPGTKEAQAAGEAAGWVFYIRGMDHYNAGNTKAALENWTKTVEVAPGSEPARQAQERIMRLQSPLGL